MFLLDLHVNSRLNINIVLIHCILVMKYQPLFLNKNLPYKIAFLWHCYLVDQVEVTRSSCHTLWVQRSKSHHSLLIWLVSPPAWVHRKYQQLSLEYKVLKGLCHASHYFFKKLKMSLHQFNSPKKMVLVQTVFKTSFGH